LPGGNSHGDLLDGGILRKEMCDFVEFASGDKYIKYSKYQGKNILNHIPIQPFPNPAILYTAIAVTLENINFCNIGKY
jgi:hypothetical protein